MFDKYFPQDTVISWDQMAASTIALIVVVVAALALHRVLFGVLNRIARISATPIDGMVFDRLFRPLRWSFAAFAIAFLAQRDAEIATFWNGISSFVVPALLGWVALALVQAFAHALELHTEVSIDPVDSRSRRTRIAILSRVAIFAIVLVTSGLILLAIPGVRDIGVTLMASAGLAALALGAAAQPALKSLIAGLQMAITEPLRLGDLVVVEGHTGRVEEIRMSFVIVRTWDERAVIVPTSSFLDQSFENWSRKSEKLTGPVFLHLDPATDIAPIRAEFERFVAGQKLWDKRTSTLLMTQARPETVELRLAVSSKTISDLFALRCIVREHMVQWLHAEMPGALIRHRLLVGVSDRHTDT